jgi:hypothetical protein
MPQAGPKLIFSLILTGLLALLLALPLIAAEDDLPVLVVPPPGNDSKPASAAGKAAGGPYQSALLGRYLDEAPAKLMAGKIRARGVTAFVLKRRVVESRFIFDKSPVGDFYLVLAGLFTRRQEAEFLGQRLVAQGLAQEYRVVVVEDPVEIEATAAQNLAQNRQAAKTSQTAGERAGRPLPPSSPVVTGQAYRQNINGRYIGSYRDPLEAREQARRLTAGGWPASVEAAGGWYRVFMAPSPDTRDFKADQRTLTAAKAEAENQTGLFILADSSNLYGQVNQSAPDISRSDASACAGFSEAGRLGALLRRTIGYVPDLNLTGALFSINSHAMKSFTEAPQRLVNWWNDQPEGRVNAHLFGPAPFNRPEVDLAIGRIETSPKPASLAQGIKEVYQPLSTINGPKTLLIFSEFMGDDPPAEVLKAATDLESGLGQSLNIIFVYGDSSGEGYRLAEQLAASHRGQAWDGCRLLNDNAYFEKYIKSIFR